MSARRMLPIWFWRFEIEKSGQESVFRSSGYSKRKYSSPIAIYLALDVGSAKKPLEKSGVEDVIEHSIRIDLGECIRLGEVFKMHDAKLDFSFYLPIPGDIYQWNNTLYEIHELAPDRYYAPVERYVTWKGDATQLRVDSVGTGTPLSPMEYPIKGEHPLWVL
jgi:hypothetical protein